MRAFLLSGVVLAVATLAHAQGRDQPRILLQDGAAHVEGGSLLVTPGTSRMRVRVIGAPVTRCIVEVEDGAEPAAPSRGGSVRCEHAHTLGADESLRLMNGSRTVARVTLTSTAPSSPFLPWGVALGCALAAVMAGLQWWRGEQDTTDSDDPDRRHLAESAKRLREATELLGSRGETTSRATTAASWTPPAASPPAVPEHAPARRRGSSTADLVLAALDRWCAVIQQRPATVEAPYLRLRALAADGADGIADPNDTQKVIRDLVRQALLVADDPMWSGDPQAERELERLVQASGLTLIEPHTGDVPDDTLHRVTGRDPAPSTQARQQVSKVERRGLMDGRAVLSKAEVRVYD